jgi:hypothetical protein
MGRRPGARRAPGSGPPKRLGGDSHEHPRTQRQQTLRRFARPGPRLVVSVALADDHRIHLSAQTYEDEQRLRVWLARSDTLELLGELCPGC